MRRVPSKRKRRFDGAERLGSARAHKKNDQIPGTHISLSVKPSRGFYNIRRISIWRRRIAPIKTDPPPPPPTAPDAQPVTSSHVIVRTDPVYRSDFPTPSGKIAGRSSKRRVYGKRDVDSRETKRFFRTTFVGGTASNRMPPNVYGHADAVVCSGRIALNTYGQVS